MQGAPTDNLECNPNNTPTDRQQTNTMIEHNKKEIHSRRQATNQHISKQPNNLTNELTHQMNKNKNKIKNWNRNKKQKTKNKKQKQKQKQKPKGTAKPKRNETKRPETKQRKQY